MKYINFNQKPLKDPNSNVVLDPLGFISYYVDRSKPFTSDSKSLRMGNRIMETCMAAAKELVEKNWIPGEQPFWVGLESEDHDLLLRVVKTPDMLAEQLPYPVLPSRLCLPYVDMLEEAKDKKPEDEADSESKA